MRNFRLYVIIGLLTANVLGLAYLFWHGASPTTVRLDYNSGSVNKYTLYIGTSDGVTGEQKISVERAREITNDIIMKYSTGYSSVIMAGGWRDDAGRVYKENTLVYTIIGVDDKAIKAIMDEILPALGQDSILVEHEMVDSYYYPK